MPHIVGYADVAPVSERTAAVRDVIVAAVPGINAAVDVTEHTLRQLQTSIYAVQAFQC